MGVIYLRAAYLLVLKVVSTLQIIFTVSFSIVIETLWRNFRLITHKAERLMKHGIASNHSCIQ